MTTTANLVITFDETVDVESGDNDNIVGTSYNDVIFGAGTAYLVNTSVTVTDVASIMSVSQVTDEVLYAGLVGMQEL